MNIYPNHIREGNIAEINIIDPKYKWVFNEEHIYSKSKNSPILGMELIGKVLVTINKGYITLSKS